MGSSDSNTGLVRSQSFIRTFYEMCCAAHLNLFPQANYQFSPYIAEMANTLSNLVTVVFALHGANMARIENLPARYSLGFLVRTTHPPNVYLTKNPKS